MDESSTLRAFQKILPNWRFQEPSNWAEDFAIKRYQKKMESPDSSLILSRKETCWDNWLANDARLPNIRLPSSAWYQARLLLHRWLKDWKPGSLEFTTGSEFIATRGKNSLEAKLSVSPWTCTRSNFDAFCVVTYRHKGLKRAARQRYQNHVSKLGLDFKKADQFLWNAFKNCVNPGYEIFKAKLLSIVTFVEGSRFSTVPKNNEKDRPINIEPLANVLLQRMVGNGIRASLKKHVNVDLESLQDTHRVRIADLTVATIDLSNASDSVSISLCEFLLPPRILSAIKSCRSDMVLGLDGSYHLTKKVSSMGNGFTFELMTVILTALGKVFDENASVYGDDIIIRRDAAPSLIDCLVEVGFEVNKDKSFIKGPFRESCGANWHHEYGYIKSFDFKYPHNIHDCIVLYNKVVFLAKVGLYPSFSSLETALRRTIIPALRGTWVKPSYGIDQVAGSSPLLAGYFRVPQDRYVPTGVPRIKSVNVFASSLCYKEVTNVFFGFKWVPRLRTRTLKDLTKRNWAKYEMYLDSNRVAKDVLTGEGEWVKKLMFTLDHYATFEARDIP